MAQAWTADDFLVAAKAVVVAAPVHCRAEYAALSGGEGMFRDWCWTSPPDRPPADAEYCAAASGLLELLSQQPQIGQPAPGVRTTLFVPVRALKV